MNKYVTNLFTDLKSTNRFFFPNFFFYLSNIIPICNFFNVGEFSVYITFVNTDLGLKPLYVEISFSWNQNQGENHSLWELIETQIKVKFIACVDWCSLCHHQLEFKLSQLLISVQHVVLMCCVHCAVLNV